MSTGRDNRRRTSGAAERSAADGNLFWWALALVLAVARWKDAV
jgi:endo-1,4-beta-D-glucanase Y